MINILLTGGTGFIGQHLLEDLNHENFSFRILSRNKEPIFRILPENSEIIVSDIESTQPIEKAMEGIDVVVHLAAELRNNSLYNQTNINGTRNLALCAKKSGIKKFIHLSSIGVVGASYSSSRLIINEQAVCSPQNPYEKSKFEAENILRSEFFSSAVELTILRPTNVFGEHHRSEILLNFMKRIRSNSLCVFSKNATVNYVYVKEITETIQQIISNPMPGTFDIGSAMPLEQFYLYTAEKIGIKPNYIHLPDLFFKLPETTGYLGLKRFKSYCRALSNKVEYSDKKLTQLFLRNNNLLIGLDNTIRYYQLSDKL